MNVVALTTDLMDRSKLTNAIPDVSFTLTPDADVVIIDLGRGVEQVARARAAAPHARIVCYGPHVDDFTGVDADVVLARSKFFADPVRALRGA